MNHRVIAIVGGCSASQLRQIAERLADHSVLVVSDQDEIPDDLLQGIPSIDDAIRIENRMNDCIDIMPLLRQRRADRDRFQRDRACIGSATRFCEKRQNSRLPIAVNRRSANRTRDGPVG